MAISVLETTVDVTAKAAAFRRSTAALLRSCNDCVINSDAGNAFVARTWLARFQSDRSRKRKI